MLRSLEFVESANQRVAGPFQRHPCTAPHRQGHKVVPEILGDSCVFCRRFFLFFFYCYFLHQKGGKYGSRTAAVHGFEDKVKRGRMRDWWDRNITSKKKNYSSLLVIGGAVKMATTIQFPAEFTVDHSTRSFLRLQCSPTPFPSPPLVVLHIYVLNQEDLREKEYLNSHPSPAASLQAHPRPQP